MSGFALDDVADKLAVRIGKDYPLRETGKELGFLLTPESVTQQVGLEVKLVDYRSFTNDPVNAFTPLYSAALADGRSAV